MMIMPSNDSSSTVHYLAGRYPGRIGWLMGPTHYRNLRTWMPYALDNDAFSAWSKKKPWDVEAWRAMLKRTKSQVSGATNASLRGHSPLWVLVPDVVADRKATIENWWRYAPEAASFGWPLAVAVQDGMTPDDIADNSAAVVFVGGTTEWKWRTLGMWTKHFKRVHVGRVNEARRLWQCQDAGVESVDGTGWFRDTEDGRRIPALVRWLEGKRQQTIELF